MTIHKEKLEILTGVIGQRLKDHILSSDISGTDLTGYELSLGVKPSSLKTVMATLHDNPDLYFEMLIDITAVDYPGRVNRFDVVYHLLSIEHRHRLRIKLETDENTPVETVSDIYKSAGWFEREVWDMFGIYFNNHPDLRRILTDYGFDGHPLRKDFPLTGYVEMRYCEQQKRVVYEPVKLTQDFRRFDFLSPWEGVGDVNALPGDEKATTQEYGWRPYGVTNNQKNACVDDIDSEQQATQNNKAGHHG